jgi:glycosyltransferase involved in cell wall biosynthesis
VSFRLTILWSALASYNVAFFRTLAVSHHVAIQLIHQTPERDAPYASFDLSFCDSAVEDLPEIRQQLATSVEKFRPDAVLMMSWNYRRFMRIARRLRRRGVHVVSAMDNQWCGRTKQYLGVFTAPIYLRPSIDTFLVPGENQASFARKLGYEDVLYGYAAADVDSFRSELPITHRERSFLFIGRLVPAKNIAGLVEAYQLYRKRVEDPWQLKMSGTGPLSGQLRAISGVQVLGFIQPSDIAAVMNSARCLILPSLQEPWGVVIQEAGAAGLPVIASYRCGAASTYIRCGVNGYVVCPRAEEIANAMVRISEMPEVELSAMSQAGVQIASLWTPSKLASNLHCYLREHLPFRSGGTLAADALAH